MARAGETPALHCFPLGRGVVTSDQVVDEHERPAVTTAPVLLRCTAMRCALGSAAFVVITVAPIAAAAEGPRVITVKTSLDGLVDESELIVEDKGTLVVNKYGSQTGKGWLHVRATRIW